MLAWLPSALARAVADQAEALGASCTCHCDGHHHDVDGEDAIRFVEGLEELTHIDAALDSDNNRWTLPVGCRLTALFMGPAGTGKTSLWNLLSSKDAFGADGRGHSQTFPAVQRWQSSDGSLCLLDAVGFGKGVPSSEEASKFLASTCLAAPGGLSMLFYVVKFGSISEECLSLLIFLTKYVFEASCLLNLYIVVTHSPSELLLHPTAATSWVQSQAEKDPGFKQVYTLAGRNPGRFIFVDTPPKPAGRRVRDIEEQRRSTARTFFHAFCDHPSGIVADFTTPLTREVQDKVKAQGRRLLETQMEVARLRGEMRRRPYGRRVLEPNEDSPTAAYQAQLWNVPTANPPKPVLPSALAGADGEGNLKEERDLPSRLEKAEAAVLAAHEALGNRLQEVLRAAIYQEQEFASFVINYLGGERIDGPGGEDTFACNVFLCRGRFENNLAQWTMRLCDWMVDKLGWSFIVSSLCNMGDCGQNRLEQVIFRFDGDKRALPVSKVNNPSDEFMDSPFPDYWIYQEVLERQEVHKVRTCATEEKESLQQLVDATFRRILTRDRVPDDDAVDDEEMPYRIEVVHAFRSEHAWLNHRLFQSRQAEIEDFGVKTGDVDTLLKTRLVPGEAYLFHGTNPSSAMSILKTGFVLDHAGSATGTMYGAGVYMAECSSKSDEYGRDDGGNTYPSLHAMLVCKCFVGVPFVTDTAGDHVPTARRGGNHCICGDREAKVGTYREFVFFDEEKVYPEYAIIYRRQYDKSKVPEEMVQKTTGTTGRFWQMKAPDWRNVPPELNKVLIQAMKDGQEEVQLTLNGTEYSFNLTEKKGTNLRTGNKVPLRAPMVK